MEGEKRALHIQTDFENISMKSSVIHVCETNRALRELLSPFTAVTFPHILNPSIKGPVSELHNRVVHLPI